MQFICKNCNQRMKSQDVVGAGNGTMYVSSFCAKCGGRFTLLSNQGETLFLKAVNAGPSGQELMSRVLEQAQATLPLAVDQSSSDILDTGVNWEDIRDEWIRIDPGKYTMGSPESEPGREIDEFLHEVQISGNFLLGKCVVTQGQWESIMGTTPWIDGGMLSSNPAMPAVCVSWEDTHRFIEKLNDSEADNFYRLPTEAEWEYACRAGTTSMWSFGEDRHILGNYAWYVESESRMEDQYPREVGTRIANPWGLHDMHGNVWEWCHDIYDHDYYSKSPLVDPKGPEGSSKSPRVVRGGYYRYFTRHSRSASRNARDPFERHRSVGFRLVKNII